MPLSIKSSLVWHHWECRSAFVDFVLGQGRFFFFLKGGGWSDRVVSIITAQVGRHMSVRMARNVGVGVNSCSG